MLHRLRGAWRRRMRRLMVVWRYRGARGREAALLRSNVKALGSLLAQQAYAEGRAGPHVAAPAEPQPCGLGSRICSQADIESPWLQHWCREIGMAPLFHRKVWEDAFVIQTLWEAGAMAPGRRVLGFAVGAEPLPAFFAARGADVLATDLASDDPAARVWRDTQQHAAGAAALYRPGLLSEAEFQRRVAFREVDMNALPADLLTGGYDALWSVCAIEHLGSVEATCRFVEAAMRCLKPGGIAVHTTEHNLDPTGRTLERGSTVLLQRRHIEALGRRLEAAGHALLPLAPAPPVRPLDLYVDLPPYSPAGPGSIGGGAPAHLRLAFAGFRVTSVGLVIRAAA